MKLSGRGASELADHGDYGSCSLGWFQHQMHVSALQFRDRPSAPLRFLCSVIIDRACLNESRRNSIPIGQIKRIVLWPIKTGSSQGKMRPSRCCVHAFQAGGWSWLARTSGIWVL
jgi:hypothetical protein